MKGSKQSGYVGSPYREAEIALEFSRRIIWLEDELERLTDAIRSQSYDREEAMRDLAEIAYGSRDAIWTSHRTLVHTALKKARDGS